MPARWLTLLGLGIALALLWWLFRDEDPAEVWGHIRGADPGLLLLAVALTTATFPVRAIRWHHLLAPVQPDAPFSSRFEAVCIGFMTNNLLPRVGELARAYAYARRERIPTVTALATLVVERFLDGVAILLLLVAALAWAGLPAGALPPEIVTGIRLVGLFLALALVGSVALLAAPERGARLVRRLCDRVLPARWAPVPARLVGSFAGGLASLRGWRLMLPAVGWSFAVWTLQSLSFWVGFAAFDIRLGFDAALVTNGSTAIASTIPTPGFFGTFHAAAKLALANLYGVAETSALGFAVGWHLGAFVPITILGLWYARRLGLSLREIGSGRGERAGTDGSGTAGAAP